MLKLPKLPSNLPIVDQSGYPGSVFQQYWQQFANAIQSAIDGLAEALAIAQDAIAAATAASADALAAANAADAAQASADGAISAATAISRQTALMSSYINPNVTLSATPTTITIAAHTRFYTDGTNVSVGSGSVSTTGGAGATDYVSYIDPARTGGSVTYTVSTAVPTQAGDVHVVGAVKVPATGTATGGNGPQRPGYVVAP